MSFYEHIIMISPELGQNQVRLLLDKYKKLIEKFDGKIISYEFWGLRKLAYQINKNEKAFYFLLNIEGDHNLTKELSQFGNQNTSVMRYLTVKTDKFDLNSELKSDDLYDLMSGLSQKGLESEGDIING